MKLLTKKIASQLIETYQHAAETGEGGKQVLAKFFTPWSNCTWFITEGMPVLDDGEPVAADRVDAIIDPNAYDWHLFGFCDIGDVYCAELGYVMLSDLTGLHGPVGLRVERDLYYAGSLADVLQKYEQARAA